MAFSSVAKPSYNSHHWNKKSVKLSNFKTCFQIYSPSFTYSIHRSNASRLTYLKYQTPAQECTKAMGWWLHIYTKPKKNLKCIQNSILTIRVPYMIVAV